MIHRDYFADLSLAAGDSEGTSLPTLLVVDDCSIIRSLLHLVLTHSGFQVILAENGPDALAQCERHAGTIDLVLCDTSMKPWDGAYTIHQLRKAGLTVPFVYMIGVGSEQTVAEMEAQGARAIFAKPLCLPDLVAGLHRIVREKGAVVAV